MDEVVKFKIKMAFYFKISKRVIKMSGKDHKHYRDKSFCRFCEKNNKSDKVRDSFRLTAQNRGPAHNKCIIDVTQKKK